MKKAILMLGGILLIFSCKKDPKIPFCELNPDECVDIREIKEWFYFGEGSYWVYEEENSGLRDSIYPLPEYLVNDTGSYYFSTHVYSTYNDCEYHFWTNGAINSAKHNNIVEKSLYSTGVKRSKSSIYDGLIGESLCFIFYPKKGDFRYTNGGGHTTNNKITVEDFKNSMDLNGQTFSDVVLMDEGYTAIENSQPTKHYYAKGVGLIRKELIDSNQVWNLVDYHIEN